MIMRMKVLPPDEAERNARAKVSEWKHEKERRLLGRDPLPHGPSNEPEEIAVVRQETMNCIIVDEETERARCKNLHDLMKHYNRWLWISPQDACMACVLAKTKIEVHIKKKGLRVNVSDLLDRAVEKHQQGLVLTKVEQTLMELDKLERSINDGFCQTQWRVIGRSKGGI